jgi:hypothetical protein
VFRYALKGFIFQKPCLQAKPRKDDNAVLHQLIIFNFQIKADLFL